VLALVIQYTPLHKALWWQDSVLAPWLTEALGWVLPLPEEWGQYLPKASS
jgi:membrane protein required for colicin V production